MKSPDIPPTGLAIMPCSPEQLAANRRNAQKSSGPRTEEGKARSRANGLKHGLTGQGVVIPPEDAEEVDRRSGVLEAEMKPSNELSRILVRRVAALSVRLERSVRQEFASVAERSRNARINAEDAQLSEVERMLSWITAEPATYARRLRQSPEGIDAVIRALLDVKADLLDPDDRRWHAGHSERIENLIGRRTSDFPTWPIKGLCWASWGDFSKLTPDQGRGLSDPDRKQWARDRVAEFLDEEIARLRELRGAIDLGAVERDRLEASERALFDPSKEATLARKYEAATERSLFRTLREIREAEAAPPEEPSSRDMAETPDELGSSLPARSSGANRPPRQPSTRSPSLISSGNDRPSGRPGRRNP